MHSIGTWWMWAIFFGLIAIMLLVDIRVMHGGERHRVSVKEAAGWSIVWVSVALLFSAALWWYLDSNVGRVEANAKTLEFLTGYVLEKSLAVDNVFVWLMLFAYFGIPLELQRRVLLYGVAGAIVLRAIMVFVGAWLIQEFHWILYVFGAFLLFTGARMLMPERETDLADSRVIQWMRRHMRLTPTLEGERFMVVRDGVRYATPLFLALILVEISDVIFAVDSIPAIFAVTRDPFIVLTSNIFAILGLRAMYFLLAEFADRFAMLKYGLAVILIFIGTKMLIVDFYKIPISVSLAVITSLLLGSVIWSLRQKPAATEHTSS